MRCKHCQGTGYDASGQRCGCLPDYPFPWWVLIIATALWTLAYLSIY